MIQPLPYIVIATLTAHATSNTGKCEVKVGETLDGKGDPIFRVWVPDGMLLDGRMCHETRNLREATHLANEVITNILLGN